MGNSKFAFINLRGTFKFNAAVSPTLTATVNKINALTTYGISIHLYKAILIYIKTLHMEKLCCKTAYLCILCFSVIGYN